jgi:hypothetical protein
MALSSRDKPFRDSSLFVIGLEGEMSGAEYQYFQEVLQLELLDPRRVRFEFLPTSAEHHNSDPEAVFARVKQYTEEHGLKPFDRVWAVLDVDSWGEKKLSSVASKIKQCGFSLAARQLAVGQAADARWPCCPGTDIYLLFEDLARTKAFAITLD